MEKELVNLIYSKYEKNYPKTERNNYSKEKNINLDFYFQKNSINLINKIRDLFIEFDVDHSDSFDQNEFYKMFNLNKIPIKMEEIIYLFKFSNRKKTISFSELIKLTFDSDFDKRYKDVITKIKPRCEIGIICPNDFSGMLSHLCEFGKLSSNAKKYSKNILKIKRKSTRNIAGINSKLYIRSKTKQEIDMEKIKENKNNDKDKLKRESLKINEENKLSRNVNNLTDFEFINKSQKLKEENDNIINTFKTILEITNKKVKRNDNLFRNINYRNKIETSKRHLAKSIDILHKINPKMNNTYISFCPLNQKFIDLNTGIGYDFKVINEYKSKKLKINKTENFSKYNHILNEINNKRKKKYNTNK